MLLLVLGLLGCPRSFEDRPGAPAPDVPCDDGEALTGPDGSETGLVLCGESDDVYRVGPASCAASVPSCTFATGCDGNADCGVGEVCTDMPGGDCLCVLPCTTDDDCAADEMCLCETGALSPFSRCMDTTCRSTDDCPSGACALARDLCFDADSFECRRPGDPCTSNTDCGAPLFCGFDRGAGGWYCEDQAECPG